MLVESEVENDVSLIVYSLEDMVVGQQVEGDKPIISLHALFGTEGFQTMRVQGKVKNQNMVILVNIGSTHNLVDQGLIKKVRWNL